jgi:hypothetical protein
MDWFGRLGNLVTGWIAVGDFVGREDLDDLGIGGDLTWEFQGITAFLL